MARATIRLQPDKKLNCARCGHRRWLHSGGLTEESCRAKGCRCWGIPAVATVPKAQRKAAKRKGDQAEQRIAEIVKGRVSPVAGGQNWDVENKTQGFQVKTRVADLRAGWEQAMISWRRSHKEPWVALVLAHGVYFVQGESEWK